MEPTIRNFADFQNLVKDEPRAWVVFYLPDSILDSKDSLVRRLSSLRLTGATIYVPITPLHSFVFRVIKLPQLRMYEHGKEIFRFVGSDLVEKIPTEYRAS